MRTVAGTGPRAGTSSGSRKPIGIRTCTGTQVNRVGTGTRTRTTRGPNGLWTQAGFHRAGERIETETKTRTATRHEGAI